jgi:hypothetical protein
LDAKNWAALLDGSVYDGIVIVREGDLRPVRFEEVLVEVNARAEQLIAPPG